MAVMLIQMWRKGYCKPMMDLCRIWTTESTVQDTEGTVLETKSIVLESVNFQHYISD
jgi:hypothetical protein